MQQRKSSLQQRKWRWQLAWRTRRARVPGLIARDAHCCDRLLVMDSSALRRVLLLQMRNSQELRRPCLSLIVQMRCVCAEALTANLLLTKHCRDVDC